ncbi:SMP-30/gluconolactonase/LRE family protein [Rhodococcus sp. T2V]|uniref:SMP-30/gluconolactonase/LRE family protein n=1 Tax=Rhodococcus sp. T2V TaxID=3034164 RepID=UPI0023E29E09|nr:SMP-30/gluconolactonase/LRE family protein [Rhodococcus sp. T2V]
MIVTVARKEGQSTKMAAFGTVLGLSLALAACSNADTNDGEADASGRTIEATEFAKIGDTHKNSKMGPHYNNLLEGPVFGPDGYLYLTDVAAPAGEPKVLKLNMDTKEVTAVYTDDSSVFSSAQFSPNDRKLYLTDFTGAIKRMDADGTNVETLLEGPVEGRTMVADDIAFDRDGNMYITDLAGSPWNPTGRIIRLGANGGPATVIQDGLAGPNGISFNLDYSRLWVSEYTANRMSNLEMTEDGLGVASGSIRMYASYGLGTGDHGENPAALDSTAVDADGNIYQAVLGAGEILVWNSAGDLLATVVTENEDGVRQLSVTNLAIEPGTTNAYATVAGKDGSYIYSFDALGVGIAQTNGGGLAEVPGR